MADLPTLSSVSASTAQQSSAPASTDTDLTSSSASGSAQSSITASASASTLTNAPDLGGSSSSSISGITGAPTLSSGTFSGLTGLPTLSGYYSYPPPTVPPTANAPYMQKNNLPENFVFIVVGACIAFVALLIIAWRILTSWSINRRFRRDAGHNVTYTPLTDFKQKPNANASSNEMKVLQNLPRSFSSVPSLFFSPTAEVARHSARPTSQVQSHHLPSGHYRDASDGARR